MALHDEGVVRRLSITVAARERLHGRVAWCCGLPDSRFGKINVGHGALEEDVTSA